MVLSGCVQETSSESTNYYLIRHAEKDRSDSSNQDPHLTKIGKARAKKWADILQHITFDAVYSTNFNRTRETGLPTALTNNVGVTLYNENNINVSNFLKETKGKTILVVGHSNTIPEFVNTILEEEKYQDIEDSNNGNLYIINIVDKKKLDQVLTFN